jgi:hypothetical protein
MEYHWDAHAEKMLRRKKSRVSRTVRKKRKRVAKRPSGCWLWAAGLDLVLVGFVIALWQKGKSE